jgi:signal transduction histidine kinase
MVAVGQLALNWYFKIYHFIAYYRLKKADLEPRHIHTHTVIVLTTGVIKWSYAILAFDAFSTKIPGAIAAVCSLIHLFSPLMFRFTNSALLVGSTMLFAGLIQQSSFAYFSGGFESSFLIWLGILPMLAGLIAGKKGTLLWFGNTVIVAIIFLVLRLNQYSFPNAFNQEEMRLTQILLVFGWIFLSSCIIFFFVNIIEKHEKTLQEQSQKIDNLFKVLFHDLANPLGRLSIGLSILKKEESSPRFARGVKIASEAANSMMDITQNVRKIYAVSKGHQGISLTLTELNSSINYISNVFAPDLDQKSQTLNFDFEKYQGLKLYVDPISFNNQVLGNIISNAIKFSPNDSVIQIRAYPIKRSWFAVEIADRGVGMPESIKRHLFDISQKTSRPGTSNETGTGFGMQIMKSFIDMYQGKIEIDSHETNGPLRGTTVKLILQGKWD